MKVLYLVRHCKAEGQEPEANLTIEGVESSYVLCELLSTQPIDYIVSSPYKRAMLSNKPLSYKLGLPIHMADRLIERVLTNQPVENWLEMLEATFKDVDLCYEGGESSRQAMERAISLVDELLQSEYEHIVIVSHGNLISLMLMYFNPTIGFKDWKVLSNPDVYRVEVSSRENTRVTRMW